MGSFLASQSPFSSLLAVQVITMNAASAVGFSGISSPGSDLRGDGTPGGSVLQYSGVISRSPVESPHPKTS